MTRHQQERAEVLFLSAGQLPAQTIKLQHAKTVANPLSLLWGAASEEPTDEDIFFPIR